MESNTPCQQGTLEALPQEVLETIAEFCGDVASISPNEQRDTFLHDVIHPYLDSATSNTWQPAYRDLQALALTSETFTNPAQRALFKVAIVKTTGHLVCLLHSLLLYPSNRRYVRCFVAILDDHPRPLPHRFIAPHPLVLGEFLYYLYPILPTTAVQGLSQDSFFHRTVPLLQETWQALLRQDRLRITLPIIDSTVVNLHILEDQLLTTTIQLCPKLTASRVCFGLPQRHTERPAPATQSVENPPIYATLLDNYHNLQLKSLTLDFGALLSLTNIRRYVSGYQIGLPPSVERLTLVGNKTLDSVLSYHLFDLTIFARFLSTNNKLRQLRMLHGFDKLVSYKRFRPFQPPQENWNSLLLKYRNTLEVLVMDPYGPWRAIPEARYGHSGMLDCLVKMEKLRYLGAPLHALGSAEFGLPLGAEDSEVTWSIRAELPPRWQKLEVMIIDLFEFDSDGERLTWRVVEFQSSPSY
ncbi:hypothetical protein QR685DRAFT_65234 [Neurospora intermedia]|uniref:F-box domain-containing protein n=1 Tax=Neurospora intermedia TaxID=5142 RepID=A0ABR3DTH2_NEUIN